MKERIYNGNGYEFLLLTETRQIPVTGPEGEELRMDVSHAEIIRRRDNTEGDNAEASESVIVLMNYTWPVQLRTVVSAGAACLQNDALLFTIHVLSHHRTGMALGEFTEDQFYEVTNPFVDNITCRITDIVRKTRFALAERHLEHLPNQTYPPVEGRQGPYGHPVGRKFRGIPVRKREK